MKYTYLNITRENWRSRLAPLGKLLLRWGWYIALSIAVITISSILLPDLPTLNAYQATLQVQVQLPKGHADKANTALSTSFFSSLLLSPNVLSLALPRINKLKQFSTFQVPDLQLYVTAVPVKNTNIVLLSAASDTPQDATILITDIYQAFLQKVESKRSPVIDGLITALNNELKQVEFDVANSATTLDAMRASGKSNTSQYYLLFNLHGEQLLQIDNINALLLPLTTPGVGPNSDLFRLASNSPAITTIPGASSTQGLRIAVSPLIGLIMGLGGAILADRFSTRLPLSGKKREKVLRLSGSVIPVMPGLAKQRLQVLQQTASYYLPLLRRLRYQAGELEKRLQVITVTSPKGREGKSTIAAGMAIAAAQTGLQTLLVDANPGKPVLHTWFRLPNTKGTLNAVYSSSVDEVDLSSILDTGITKLSLLPIGNTSQKPKSSRATLQEELRVDKLHPFIDLLCSQADLIIFDAPALLTDANATNLVMFSDAIVLVVNAKRSRSTQVLEAETLLSEIGVSSNIVINRARPESVE